MPMQIGLLCMLSISSLSLLPPLSPPTLTQILKSGLLPPIPSPHSRLQAWLTESSFSGEGITDSGDLLASLAPGSSSHGGNIGHFDNEIDMHGLETYPGVKRITIKPQTDRRVFPETNSGIIVLAEGRLMNLGCATGHPNFLMSCSFTNQVLQVIAQLEMWNERTSGKYEKKVYVLPKHLDEKVAALHLGKLGAKLTKLTLDQSAYLSIPVEGPYKPTHYRF